MGLFVELIVDDSRFDGVAQSAACVRSCPVDIYELAGSRLTTVAEREDECILCGLCLAAAPIGAVTIRRRYGSQRAVTGASP